MIILTCFIPQKNCNVSNLPKKIFKKVSWFDTNQCVLRSIQTFCLVKPHQTSIFIPTKLITFYILKKKQKSMFHPSNFQIDFDHSNLCPYDFPSPSLGWSLHALEPRSKRAETERGARFICPAVDSHRIHVWYIC